MFSQGFEKTAGLWTGLKAGFGHSVGDTLTLKPAREAISGLHGKYKGGLKNLLTTSAGRSELAEAVGKSVPSAAVGGIYLSTAKKLLGSGDQQQEAYYQ